MISPTMVVKARKIQEDGDNFYLEFQLTENQAQGLIAELLLAHIENNTLTVKHVHENDGLSKNERMIERLREILKENADLPHDIKHSFMTKILELSDLKETKVKNQ